MASIAFSDACVTALISCSRAQHLQATGKVIERIHRAIDFQEYKHPGGHLIKVSSRSTRARDTSLRRRERVGYDECMCVSLCLTPANTRLHTKVSH